MTSSAFLFIIFLMKTLLSFYHTHKKNCYFIVGLIFASFLMITFLLLGTGSIVTYHDQLDGELLNYILAARYLFTDIRIYPEIMNGLPAAGAVPPAPLFVLLYALFKPFTAFLLSQWIIYLVAFSGMYLLLLKLTRQEFISFGISMIFTLLPFYPVYGLCIPGQPLLFYAVLSLEKRETARSFSQDQEQASRKRPALFYYLLIVLYGACSSPVLVGFACLIILGIFAVLKSVAALRYKKSFPLPLWLSTITLLFTYLVCNRDLVRQVLFPESTYISHKTELVLSAQDPVSYFKDSFGTGISYAQSYPKVLLLLIPFCSILFFLHMAVKKEKSNSHLRGLFFRALVTFSCIVIICLLAAFYHGSYMTQLRNSSDGIIKTFNLDRICWLLPAAWCILAAYLLSFVMNFFQAENQDSALARNTPALNCLPPETPLWKRILRQGIVLATLGLWGIIVLFHSAAYPNIAKLLKNGNYYALDWDRFFAADIFDQIDGTIGRPKEDFRVISVGIYPAAAVYNGFYCLDGYSNNYPLSYKHTFRQIIADELDKSDYIRALFDNWGNRCYITTAEQSDYYTFEKKWNSVIYDLALNTEVLKELNCQYVFSAAYLMNAEENGLTLLREAPFETQDSWYHIYVYEVAE